ncbi:hypothetical protein JCM10908_001151 [Rhodotorula pacifica]|uniref:DNA helicase n=1 Tax=Rhodotorula pacifica TaxID=1495444 RepID=UPI003176C84E
MAPQAGRQQGGPGTSFHSTATTSRSFAHAQAAAQTPQLHSSSSIYDNDDETEAVLADALGQSEEEEGQFAEQAGGGEDNWQYAPRTGYGGVEWETDEYGFRDPPSPSPTASTRFPRSGFLGSAPRGQSAQYQYTSSFGPGRRRDAAPAVTSQADASIGTNRTAPTQYARSQASASAAGPVQRTQQGNGPFAAAMRGSQGMIKPMPVRPAISTNLAPSAHPQQQLGTVSNQKSQVQPTRSKWQLAGHAATTPLARIGRVEEDEEAMYWRDDAFEAGFADLAQDGSGTAWDDALATADQSARRALARSASPARAARMQTQHEHEQDAQDLEDLEPNGGLARAARAPQTGVRKQGVKLKPVSSLPDMFRSLWRFGVFNAVQSTCFDSVYSSDDNVVISAPTGAGKTVLFELAMLRLFTTSSSNDSKVLYMAPTKSLCSERVADWKKKFEVGLGWTVQELTGDSDFSTGAWRDVAKARIIVTTPEKWDSMTRKWHDHGTTLGQLRLFCIDEVHSVGSDRGAVLEVVVSRMKTLGTDTRFVAVSATVPNIADVAEWLGSDSTDGGPAKVFQFGDDFRPCKLQKVVIGYPRGANDFAFANSLSFKLYDLIKQYSSGEPVLIFCNTRKSCTQAAEALLKSYKEAVASTAARKTLGWPKPSRSEFKTGDKALSALLEYGIAVHHAGMEMNDRKLVERLFTDSKISVVCSTSTLAMGVNLPARLVIIRGTKTFADGVMRDYTDLEILQMIGRAGRPQFDTLGVAVIMTEKGCESKYSDLVNAQTRLESCLHNSLTEHINSEIALGTIQDVASALHWLRSTFLFVRITKNCAFYGLGKDTASPEQRLEEICLRAVDQLVQGGIVEREEDSLVANQYGDIMSKFYISHETFVAIKTLPLKSGMRTLLETIAAATEMSSYRFRQGEKSVSSISAPEVRMPMPQISNCIAFEQLFIKLNKVMILIQLALEGIPGSELKTESTNPMLDVRGIFVAATRIAKCMVDVAIAREDGAIRTALELLRSLNGRGWDNSAVVLRQLEGIGEKSYKALAAAGITSFEDVRNADPDRLQIILSRKPPYGHKLISQARAIPQFEIAVVSKNETICAASGVQVDVSLDLRLKYSKTPPAVKRAGVKFWATVATTTSDNEFIDFRRARLDQLLTQPKQFDLSVVLVKPSQKLVVSVSCESVAGSEVKLVIKPDTPAREFPLPALDLPENQDEPFQDASVAWKAPPAPRPVKTDADIARKTAEQEEAHGKPAATLVRQRADGKYECNHACGDKSKCKHLCCREGLDKPPVRRKSANGGSRSKADHNENASETAAKPPKKATRLKPLASAGVTLQVNSKGKAVAKKAICDEDEQDESAELDELDELDSDSSSESDDMIVTRAPADQARQAGPRRLTGTTVDGLDVFASPSPPRPAANNHAAHKDDHNKVRGQSLRRPRQLERQEERQDPSKRMRLALEEARTAPLRAATVSRSGVDRYAEDDHSSSPLNDAAEGLFLPVFEEDAEMVEASATTSTFPEEDPFADLRRGTPSAEGMSKDDRARTSEGVGTDFATGQSDDAAGEAEEAASEADDFDAWLESNVLVV